MASRTAEDYDRKDLRTHIYDIPDTYVGSTDRKVKKEIIFNTETKKMEIVDLDLPEAVKRIVMEIISNAGDNSFATRFRGRDPGILSLDCDEEGYLSVKNGGDPIPVEPHKLKINKDETEQDDDEELYLLPTDIFSVLLTSSNYDEEKDRLGCGRNGYGSKLTNIFSKHFIVRVGDSGRIVKGKKVSGQEYIGEWKNNMKETVKTEAKPGFEKKKGKWERITKGEYNGPSYVEVTWKTDFKRMNMDRDHFSAQEFGLFARYMLEFSLTCGVPVEINGERYDLRSIKEYAKMIFDENLVNKSVVAFDDKKFPKEFEKLKSGDKQEKFIAEKFIPETQFLLLDTPDESRVFSYVNGLMTPDGGVHLDKLQNKLSRAIVTEFNKRNKNNVKIKKEDVLPHISIILVNRLKNTKYDSQQKKRLEAPVPQIDLDPKMLTYIMSKEWNLMNRLEASVLAKNMKDITKTDGKKVAHLNIKKDYDDANFAARNRSLECTLYIVEGHSASGYPKRRISKLPGGKDLNGVYPLQGKVMNVKTHSIEKVNKYEEFENLKKILGLRQNVDYSIEKNRKSHLRYGKVCFNVDADSDGMHIMGLLINMFYEYWPQLYEMNFIQLLVTPVVRVKDKKEVHRFYDERTFAKWIEKHPHLRTKAKYYKGLGSSSKEDIIDDVKTAPTLILDMDKLGVELVERAFDGERSNDRKVWISEWRDERDTIEPFEPKKLVEHRPVSELMGKAFPPYMTDSIIRAIPSKFDGLKRSQRQVAYYALHHYKYGTVKKLDKVIAFAPNVVPYSKYHHGEKSLNDTVMKMARPYCNGNNLPFFYGEGEFGTRNALGKDAAQPRYPSLGSQWWFPLMYDQDMVELVDKKIVDGEPAEPFWLVQTIPLGLVNGNKGMATGYSSFIPMHHPCDIIEWIVSRLSGKKRINPIPPYYNGFRGEIHIYSKSKKEEKSKSPEDGKDSVESSSSSEEEIDFGSDDEYPEFTSGRGFDIYGKFEVSEARKGDKVDVVITEIPFTVAPRKFIKGLKDMIEKKLIEDIRVVSAADEEEDGIKIEIKGLKRTLATYEGLGLRSGLPLTNMYLIDNDGIPKKYNSIESILDECCDNTLSVYKEYKNVTINKKKEELAKLDMELAIIEAYLSKKLLIAHRTDEQVDKNLEELKLDKKTFDSLNLRKLTKSRVDALKAKISEQQAWLEEFKSKTAETMWLERLNNLKEALEKKGVCKSSYIIEDEKRVLIDGQLSFKEAIIKFN